MYYYNNKLSFFEGCLMFIGRHLELPDWNLSCLRRITDDHCKKFCQFTFLMKPKMTSPDLMPKSFGILVNNNKIVNKII